MSYILDALKKSEQERKKGKVPGLGTLQGLPGPGGRFETDRLIWLYGLATIILLVALGLGIWLFMREPAPTPEETVPVATVQSAEADKTVAPPAVKPAQPARDVTKTAPAPTKPKVDRQTSAQPPTTGIAPVKPLKMPAPEAAARPSSPAAPVLEKPEPAPAQFSETSPENSFSEDDVQENAAPARPEQLPTVPFEELPAETRAEMPEIKIGVHFYSDTPASRRASINGRLMREGQTIDRDLLLVEITRQGAIFSFQGRKFTLPVFPR